MGMAVKLPIMIRTDNIGAMIMAEYANSVFRTRQIDNINRFIREHFEDGFIKIVFLKTD
jgi:hypothetical protein